MEHPTSPTLFTYPPEPPPSEHVPSIVTKADPDSEEVLKSLDSNHVGELPGLLFSLLKASRFCDCGIQIASGQVIQAHSVVLVACSSVIGDRLRSSQPLGNVILPNTNSNQYVLDLTASSNVTENEVLCILEYCYTGLLRIKAEVCSEKIVALCEELGLGQLKELCEKIIGDTVATDTNLDSDPLIKIEHVEGAFSADKDDFLSTFNLESKGRASEATAGKGDKSLVVEPIKLLVKLNKVRPNPRKRGRPRKIEQRKQIEEEKQKEEVVEVGLVKDTGDVVEEDDDDDYGMVDDLADDNDDEYLPANYDENGEDIDKESEVKKMKVAKLANVKNKSSSVVSILK